MKKLRNKEATMNRLWLERQMELRGITYHALRYEFKFHPDTLTKWEQGTLARPDSLRRLAGILDAPYLTVVKNLGVKVMSARERKARAPQR